MAVHWRILAPLFVIVVALIWHFGSGIISGVPFGDLLRWESILDSILLIREIVLFPIKVVTALAVYGFVGVLVWFGLGIFLIGTPYMFYVRWREKRRWTEVSRKSAKDPKW